jgi:hypothetical protein
VWSELGQLWPVVDRVRAHPHLRSPPRLTLLVSSVCSVEPVAASPQTQVMDGERRAPSVCRSEPVAASPQTQVMVGDPCRWSDSSGGAAAGAPPPQSLGDAMEQWLQRAARLETGTVSLPGRDEARAQAAERVIDAVLSQGASLHDDVDSAVLAEMRVLGPETRRRGAGNLSGPEIPVDDAEFLGRTQGRHSLF